MKFLTENNPEGLLCSVDTGELDIVLPGVQDSILTEWMGKACRYKRGDMLSYSVMEQARAAIIWLYKRNNVQISATCMEAVSFLARDTRILKRHTWKSTSCFFAVLKYCLGFNIAVSYGSLFFLDNHLT